MLIIKIFQSTFIFIFLNQLYLNKFLQIFKSLVLQNIHVQTPYLSFDNKKSSFRKNYISYFTIFSMKKGILSLSVFAAILAAFVYFLNSVLHLIGYAISNKMIQSSSNALIEFIFNNYKTLNILFLSILILTSVVIYISFIYISKKSNSKLLMASSILIFISTFIFLLLSLLSVLKYNLPSILSSNYYKIESYSWILFFLFGIALLISKLNTNFSKILGTFYILESLILLSAIFLPVRLAEFTIAIRIIEAFFFNNLKNKII